MVPSSTAESPALDHVPAESVWIRRMRAIWPWFAAVLSGVLLCLCYPGHKQGWLVWIALTPLISAVWSLRRLRPKDAPDLPSPTRKAGIARRAFALGYLSGVIFFAYTFRWLAELAPLFKTPWLTGLPVLLGLYMALYPAVWAVVLVSLPREKGAFSASIPNLGIAAAAACTWTALEWTRGWLFSGFGWNGLGVALHQDLAMIQIADLVGVLGLSWMVVFVNVMGVVIFRRIVSEFGPIFLTRVRWEFSLTMALMAVVFAYGVRVLFQKPSGQPLQVTAIQPNIQQEDKFDPAAEDEIFAQLSKLNSLAAMAPASPDLIVWPEAATPRGMYADEHNFKFMMQEAARGDFSLLIGSLDYDLDPQNPEIERQYNAAMLLSNKGEQRSVYRKMHLVPFGEYLPLRPILPSAIGELVPGDLDAGSAADVLTIPKNNTRLGVLICFEDTLGDLTRRFVGNGAQLLVNVTNDGWFGRSVAAEQHLANALFRAIENRRPLLRCANTGVTCAIDITGRVDRGGLRNFEQGFTPLTPIVPDGKTLTLYTRWGDWVAYLSTIVMVILCIREWRRRRAVTPDRAELETR